MCAGRAASVSTTLIPSAASASSSWIPSGVRRGVLPERDDTLVLNCGGTHLLDRWSPKTSNTMYIVGDAFGCLRQNPKASSMLCRPGALRCLKNHDRCILAEEGVVSGVDRSAKTFFADSYPEVEDEIMA